MKKCTKCKKEKSIEDFGKKASNKTGIHPWCRDCARKESRKFYERHPEPYKKRARIHGKKMGEIRKAQSEAIKSYLGCFCCKEKLLCLLDYHHVIGNSKGKDGGKPVSRTIYNSQKQFLTELAKCIVVCANCHRKIHAGYVKLPSQFETAICAYHKLFDQE